MSGEASITLEALEERGVILIDLLILESLLVGDRSKGENSELIKVKKACSFSRSYNLTRRENHKCYDVSLKSVKCPLKTTYPVAHTITHNLLKLALPSPSSSHALHDLQEKSEERQSRLFDGSPLSALYPTSQAPSG